MKRKEIEIMAEQAAVVLAWCIRRLPVNEWVGWVVRLVDLVGAQDEGVADIENTLVELHGRLEERLCRGQW